MSKCFQKQITTKIPDIEGNAFLKNSQTPQTMSLENYQVRKQKYLENELIIKSEHLPLQVCYEIL